MTNVVYIIIGCLIILVIFLSRILLKGLIKFEKEEARKRGEYLQKGIKDSAKWGIKS